MNKIKVMWCRFQQCLGTFTMLLVEGSSGTAFFRHLSNHVFRVRSFGNTKAMKVISFSKRSKFQMDSKNAAKSSEKFFVSERIASELVSLNRIFLIGS